MPGVVRYKVETQGMLGSSRLGGIVGGRSLLTISVPNRAQDHLGGHHVEFTTLSFLGCSLVLLFRRSMHPTCHAVSPTEQLEDNNTEYKANLQLERTIKITYSIYTHYRHKTMNGSSSLSTLQLCLYGGFMYPKK